MREPDVNEGWRLKKVILQPEQRTKVLPVKYIQTHTVRLPQQHQPGPTFSRRSFG